MKNQLSINQQHTLQILPIPSALMSVTGSSFIIYAALRSRQKKKLTSYGRLLFFLSLYDIQSSITYAMASFLRPQEEETNKRIWSFGNTSTCTAVGFFNQVSFSNTFFVCMLSCYFLLATRFGYTNEQISKRVEPVMHVTAIGYPLVTSIISLSQGWYGEVANGLGCWIKMRFPSNCGNGEAYERICISEVVIWMFYVLPSFFALACLVINGIVMIEFVFHHHQRFREVTNRKHTKVTQEGTSESEEDEVCGDDDDLESLSVFEEGDAIRIAQQNGRLKMLASQSFLYVLSFVVCNLATTALVLLELKATSDAEQEEVIVRYFPLAVMQAIFHPLQGLLNMLIFVRPKYINYRNNKYATESRSPALFGFDSSTDGAGRTPAVAGASKPKQLKKTEGNGTDGQNIKSRNESTNKERSSEQKKSSVVPLPRDMVSSLTGSADEYEAPLKDENEQNDQRSIQECRNRTDGNQYFQSLRTSGLEMISELSESVFEPTSAEGHHDDDSQIKHLSRDGDASDSRWGSSQNRHQFSDVSPRLTLKIPLDSSSRTYYREDDLDLTESRWGSSAGRRPSDLSLTHPQNNRF